MEPGLEVDALAESLVDELVGAVALPKNRFWHRLVGRIFRPVTLHLAKIGVTFDHLVGSKGLPAGSEWALTNFCNPILVKLYKPIPTDKPLLVVSNHPGAYDALIIFSQLGRQDIRWIGSEIPFLDKLPHVRQHVLFASRQDPFNRMVVMRSAIRHLLNAGTLVYIGAGHRDPDPAVYPAAGRMMDNWLQGINFFVKHIPGLYILPVIVSGVVSRKWAQHPITLLRRRQIDKQRLSEFGQVITQLLKPGKLMLTPAISIGAAVKASDLLGSPPGEDILPVIISLAKSLLVDHCHQFGGDPGL